MALVKETEFLLGGVQSDFCMKVSGQNTVSVLAAVKKRGTSKRKPPPTCGNGFETAYLPFAKGHIIALELGGSDNASNVVPQFEKWQGEGNGPWRMMEQTIGSGIGDRLMLVEIAYDRTGPSQNSDASIEEFQKDNFIDWTDARIPSKFNVKIFASNFSPATLATETAYDAKITALKSGAAPTATYDFDLGTQKMPEPDRFSYVIQAALDIAEPQLARATSFATLFMQQGEMDKVRKKLKRKRGILATEANSVQAAPMIMAGQRITPSQLKKKRKLAEEEGLDMIPENQLFPPT